MRLRHVARLRTSMVVACALPGREERERFCRRRCEGYSAELPSFVALVTRGHFVVAPCGSGGDLVTLDQGHFPITVVGGWNIREHIEESIEMRSLRPWTTVPACLLCDWLMFFVSMALVSARSLIGRAI